MTMFVPAIRHVQLTSGMPQGVGGKHAEVFSQDARRADAVGVKAAHIGNAVFPQCIHSGFSRLRAGCCAEMRRPRCACCKAMPALQCWPTAAFLALQYMSLSTSKQACRSSEQAAALRSLGEDARCAKKTSAAEPNAAASKSGCRGPGMPVHRRPYTSGGLCVDHT